MRRFLSWIVAAGLEYLLMGLISLAAGFAVGVFGSIRQLGQTMFWIVVVLGGGTVLSVFTWLLWMGNGLIVTASQAIKPSAKGTRYIVIGTLNIGMYAFLIWATAIGAMRGASLIAEILCLICAIVFLIAAHLAVGSGET